MAMKKLEISRLMDEYVDSEFFPEGGSTADAQAVKDMVLAKARPAERKRRVSLRKRVPLAAAMAAAMVILMGAGVAMISAMSPSNIEVTLNEGSEHIDYTRHNDNWLAVEDGRFYLDFGGKRTEITGKFDADTPYIYTVTEPSGITFHYVVGGTPENYGYTEFQIVPGYSQGEVSPHNAFVRFNAKGKPLLDRNERLWGGDGTQLYSSPDSLSEFNGSYRVYSDGENYVLEWRWYSAAQDQLGIAGFYSYLGDPLPHIPEF